MGIQTEYNSDLALRDISEFKKGDRKKEECIPENLKAGQIHDFLKKGQRIYWFEGEMPLVETKGNSQLSRPIASIIMIETTHFKKDNETWTKGKYKVIEVFDKEDKRIHFEACAKVDYQA